MENAFDPNRINLEIGMLVTPWITSAKSITVGKPYRIRGIFKYVNTYGSPGNKYRKVDTFITIKNNYGYTIKVNFSRFNVYERPEMTLEERVEFLENALNARDIIKTK